MHPLVRLRREQALSQRDLAKKAKVPRSTIERIEIGRIKQPIGRTLRRLAGALGCKPLDLMEPQEENVG